MVVNATGYLVIVIVCFVYLLASCVFLTYHIVKDGLGVTREDPYEPEATTDR